MALGFRTLLDLTEIQMKERDYDGNGLLVPAETRTKAEVKTEDGQNTPLPTFLHMNE